MTLTDGISRIEIAWEEEDRILAVQGRTGEDIVVELKLKSTEYTGDDLQLEFIRGDRPMPPNRYRLQMRGNVVQLTLKQSQKDDTGQYALVATRIGQPFEKGSTKKIHVRVDEPSYEEGDPPIFLRRLTDLAVKVGTRTRFLVEIRSSTNTKVIWHRNDLPIQAGSRFSFVHEGNFYCVDVAPVTAEDQGDWTCMAENQNGRSSCTSHLSVIVPKAYKRPEFVEELRALLTETGTVSLECKVVGVPTPVLRWFKDNKEIKAGDVFALTANPDDPTSLGIYTCEAVNCMGSAYSSSKVHVVGKGSREGSLKPADTLTSSGPPPVFKRILRDECCRIGDSLTLSCQVHVPPWPKSITWYNQEGRIDANEKYHVMEDGLGGYSIEVKLVEAMDEGEWKCVATSAQNVKQFTTCHVAMIIPKNYRKPRFMESLKAVLTEEGLVSFECKVVGFPTPLLRWFKDGQELKPGDVYQLTGTNSLGSYCCIARNCMGEAKSTAELTIEDIQNQLNEEERLQLLSSDKPPKFIRGLRSCEAKINEELFRFTVQVSISPEPTLSWYRDDVEVVEGDKYRTVKENLGTCHLEVRQLEISDQGEWKCVAANDYGHSVTSCFLKLIIPKHYKKPKFLESLRAILSEEGAVNLECKVIGVPQPILKWYKDGVELKPGDIHRIITGQDGTCCLGTYTCEAINCMGTVSSSASLLGFEDKINRKDGKEDAQASPNGHELARNLSLSTIHEERTSQLYDTPQTDRSITLDDRGEVSFSFDGKEVSVSLYETPDLTEEEALQIVEMYADQLSEHVTEHNVIELPPMRFVKESSTSGNLLMEAVVIDVSPDYFVSAEDGDDLRTEADFEDVSIMDDQTRVFSSPEEESLSLKRSPKYSWEGEEKPPTRPPRTKSTSRSSSKSDEKSLKFESESFHSARKDEDRPISPLSSERMDDDSESITFADALSSARFSISEKPNKLTNDDENMQSIASNVEDPALRTNSRKRKQKKEKSSSEESTSSIPTDLDAKKNNTKKKKKKKKEGEFCQRIESIDARVDDDKTSDDKSLSKNNKERILNKIERLTEPVVAIRDSLVDIDRYERFLELESEDRSRDFVLESIVKPIQTLCEEVSSVEAKALKNAGDRSLGQAIRISLLESIGGPTEELLRGIELIDRQRSFRAQRTDVIAILESLTDPVDEILMGLTRIEQELTGKAKGEKPVSFLRMRRVVSRFDESLKNLFVKETEPVRLFSYLDKVIDTLNSFLQDVSINPATGTIETVDTVLVESLSKSIEETVRALNRTESLESSRPSNDTISLLTDLLLQPTRELRAKLDTLTAALETYENKGDTLTERRGKLIDSLKESVDDTLAEILHYRAKEEKEVSIKNDDWKKESNFVEESKRIFEDTRLALREALEIYETISGSLDPRFAAVFEVLNETYDRLSARGQEANTFETLLYSVEERLNVLRDTVTDVSTIKDSAKVLKLLAPSITQLSIVMNDSSLNCSSVQPIISICSHIENIVRGEEDRIGESEKSRSSVPEKLLDPLIEIQATLSAAIQDLEDIELPANGSIARQRIPMVHEFSSTLIDLRQCISDAAHAAMSSNESQIFRSLTDVEEPLLDLRVMLATKDDKSPREELAAIKESFSTSIGNLQDLMSMVLITASSSSVAKPIKTKMKTVLKILEDIRVEILKIPKATYHTKLQDLNVDEKLGSINFSLTSVLEKQKKIAASSSLKNSIEILQENVANCAVAIASLEEPKDDEKIAKEVSRLGKPLQILQRALLTDEHQIEEEEILNDLIEPIDRLKTLMEAVVEGGKSLEELTPIVELLEEIEKDATLIAKETSKKKDKLIGSQEEKASSKQLADRINRSLDPIRSWLSTTSDQDSLRDEEASPLSSSVDELKRDVTRIAIETSYSEPPSDQDLIEALIDLREPLMRLKNAISMYHEPEDLTALETLSRPMKYLLQTIARVLEDHAEEKTLRLILDIVEEIENRIPISIKEALYKKELRQVVETLEENLSPATMDIVEEPVRGTTYESITSENAIEKDLMFSLPKILENVQLEATSILEDLEQPMTGEMTIPQTKLTVALEEFTKMISATRIAISNYDKGVSKEDEPLLILNNLFKPLTMIEEALCLTEELGVAELSVLNRLKQSLEDTEKYILRPSLEICEKDRSKDTLKGLLRVLDDTKSKIPIAMKEVSSRKEMLGYLRDISKPLESILEQMKGLETISEDIIEKDVAKILVKPIDMLLQAVNKTSQQIEILDQRKEVIKELRNMTEPLVKFLNCLSVVQRSRQSLVPEVALLDERRNVIFNSVEDLRLKICDILDKIASVEDGGFFEKSLIFLNDAILSVCQQIEKVDYSPKPSTMRLHFQDYLMKSLSRLGETIDALEKGTELSGEESIWKSLEPLKKQISLSQSQFCPTSDEFIDAEAIVEGFLYPTNQLQSALGALKESMEDNATAPFTNVSLGLLENLADSIADLSYSLSSYRAGLISEGASEGSSIIETFSAALEVLEDVKTSITSIQDMIKTKTIVDTKETERKEESKQREETAFPSLREKIEIKEEAKSTEKDERISHEEKARMEDQPEKSEALGSMIDESNVIEEKPKLMDLPDERVEETKFHHKLEVEKQEEMQTKVDENIRESDESGAKLKVVERTDEKLETIALREKVHDGATKEEIKDGNVEMKLEERKVENIVEQEEEQIVEQISSGSIGDLENKESKSSATQVTVVVVDEIIQVSKEEVESVMVVEEMLRADLERNRETATAAPTVESISSTTSEPQFLAEKDVKSEETEFLESKGESTRVDKNTEILKRIVSTLRTLETPMKDLTEFINSAKKEPLTVKSEEEHRKIRELTALIQILNDLRATSVSIRCTPAFSAYSNSKDLFSNIINSVDTMERATASILLLTQEHLVPELKEKSLIALKNLINPLESIEKSFSAVVQVEGVSRLTTEEKNKLSMTVENLVNVICNLRETVCAIDYAKSATLVHALQQPVINEQKIIPEDATETVENVQDDHLPIYETKESLETLKVSTAAVVQESVVQESVVLVETEDAREPLREQCTTAVVSKEEEPLSTSVQSSYVQLIEDIIVPIKELRESFPQVGQEEQERAFIHSLEEVEKSLRFLATERVETITAHDESVGELKQATLQRANVTPVLEELQKSIATIEEQIACEATFAQEVTLSLEKLQRSTASFQQLVETEIGLVSTSQSAALQEVSNQLEQMKVESKGIKEIEESKVIEKATSSIKQLRETVADLAKQEIEKTGTLQETGLAFALTKWIEPLESLETTFSSVLEERLDGPPLKESIGPTLEKLKTFVHGTEEYLMIGQKKLSSTEDTESLSLMRKATESLEDLKTSLAIVHESMIVADLKENLSDIESISISALQDMAKTVEEVKKCCTAIFLEPTIVNALSKVTPVKENVAILEDIISPVRLLQESIVTIEQTKLHEAEELKIPEERMSTRLLNTLVEPLQRLEKIFVAVMQGEHAVAQESENIPETAEEGAERLSLLPVLEQMDKTLATIEEQVTLEGGAESMSRSTENLSFAETIAEPLLELRASIAAVQKVAAIVPEGNLEELSETENVNALETFAKSIYDLAERIAISRFNEEAIFEAAPDTMSEGGASSIKTWAAEIGEEEVPVQVTRAMIVEQGTVESPTEAASPFSEEEGTILRTLAKPLDELREFLAVIVEERRTTESTCPFASRDEDGSSTKKAIAKPLLELRNVAAAIIEEKMAIESTREKAFGGAPMSIDPLIQPLEEVCRSIAIIQDRMLVESLQEERPAEKELTFLSVLAEPLLDLQRSIVVLEERVISPDVESLSQDLLSRPNWSTAECVAVAPLHQIEKSIAQICECVTTIQADTVQEDEQSRISPQDRIAVEKLIEPVEGIIALILNVGEEILPKEMALERRIEYQALKMLVEPLKAVSASFSLLRDKADFEKSEEEANIDVIAESLSNVERCISILEEQAVDKPLVEPFYGAEVDKSVISVLRLPLMELKESIVKVEDSSTKYLQNLEKPLKNLHAVLETISTAQQNLMAIHSVTGHTLPSIQMTRLSIKLIDLIVGINESVQSVENKIKDRIGQANIDKCIECKQLQMFNASVQDLKKCIVKIQEEGTIEKGFMLESLNKIHKSVAVIEQQNSSKSDTRSTDIDEKQTIGILQLLSPCLCDFDATVTTIKTTKEEDVTSNHLQILEKPLCDLLSNLNDLRDKLLFGQLLWTTDVRVDTYEEKDRTEIKDNEIKLKEKEEIQHKIEEPKDSQFKQKEDERLKREEEERKKQEEADTLKREEKERKKQQEADKLKQEEEERKLNEKNEKLIREEKERKKQEEAERLTREEEERRKQEEAEKLKQEEEERKLAEEAERLKREEEEQEERRKQEEADKLKREEEERKLKEENERLKREEEERRKQEEADKLKKEEEERKLKEENERLKREEEERWKQEEAEKLKREEDERKLKEENEKLKHEEDERKKQEEAERLKCEEEERRKQEEAERLKREEDERKKEEAEKLKREEDERKLKEENEKLKHEENERKKQEEAERLKCQEKERRKQEEAEKLKQEEAEREKSEAEKLKREEEERKLKEENEKLKREEEEHRKQEESERLKREEEERKLKEESEKLKREEEQKKQEGAEKLEREKDEGKVKGESENLKREVEERKPKGEAAEMQVSVEAAKEKEDFKEKGEKVVKDDDVSGPKKHDEPAKVKDDVKDEMESKQTEGEIEDAGKIKFSEERKRRQQRMKEEEERMRQEEEEERRVDEERRRKRKERRREEEEAMLEKEAAERLRIEEERRKRKEEAEESRKSREEKLKKQEMERLERKRAEERQRKEDLERMKKKEEERMNIRENERKARREESARLLKEEEDRLRRRREEELSLINKRRRERARDDTWSRLRENESDRFFNRRSIDEELSRSNRSHRFDSDLQLESTLSDTSRSHSWRESLASSGKRSIDDYMDYKLHESSLNRSLYDVGSYYGTRRRREDRINRARSISLLKYDEYHTGDTDYNLSYSSASKPPRCARIKIPSYIEYDDLDSSTLESIVQDKGKKPSFCTRLTNRTVGEGMRTRLTCTVLGHPEPRVYWKKDGQELSPSSNKHLIKFDNGMAYFELKEALVEDSGVYTCVAENTHGSSSTESTLKVYRDFVQPLSPPMFTKSIKDTYRYSDHELVLECRVRGYPSPTITWFKDGKILDDARYTQKYLDDDIYRLEISNPNASDSGRYICRASNEIQSSEISHIVHFEGRDETSTCRSRHNRFMEDETSIEASRRPRFSSLLSDHSVPTGGTIALQVEVKGMPAPEVRWLHGERKEPISISKAKTFIESGIHTLIVPEATESERGTYICRAVNAYGYVDTAATIEIISPSAIDGGKPAMFVSRPSEKSIAVAIGEDVSVSFRVTGVPKPRVTWMKGLKDITDGPRSYKEVIDDYVRLTLKRAVQTDEGTYCILVKNRYGCDRSFFSIWIKQRARSLTPLPDWNRSDAGSIQNEDELSYIKDVPGAIGSEPIVVDGGRNWLSLSWAKAERKGPAPVIAYKVDAWLMGGEGGARWAELGITPINAFDAFNLRPGGEYKFRVTPRNRYGWGESVTMSSSVTVTEVLDLPEFTKILPGQLKALQDTTIKLECEIRGDSNINIKWYRETTEINPNNDSRYSIGRRGFRCSLTIENIKEDDSGRYVCEASNKIGKVSSFARVLVVTDPKIIEADEKLRSRILGDEREERPPQFAMRLRDRRVQVTYPVRLTCQIMGYPAPEIIWLKNGMEIPQDERHVVWDDESNFHTLEIIHSTLEDSGCYMVTAKNIHGSVSCRSVLVVDKGIRAYVAPEFLYGLDAAYTVRLNDELRMSAQIEAYPSVGVVWHRDGLRLRPSRRTIMTLSHDGTVELSLAKVSSRDAGVYSCTAINEVGRAETSTRVNVIVESDEPNDEQVQSLSEGLPTVTIASPDVPYSKEPLFVTKPLSTEALEGDTVIILCEVVGDPKPEVIWLRDFLKPDYYRDAPHFRLVGKGPQYRLEIPYAKLDFTGTYSVIARNCHGEAKAVISLQIYAKGQGKETTMKKSAITHGKVLTLPMVTRELRDIRCCDGDAVTLECKFLATPEQPNVRWEKGGKIITMGNDFTSEFDGEVARLSIQHVYPEDEGEYTCVAYNELGKAFTSACIVVDVPEGKENVLSERLTRPVGLLSAGSTPRSTPRSTPIRSLSPAVSHGRELRSPQLPPRCGSTIKRTKFSPPKFYSVPHNRVVEEGETVRFQCAVVGHPTPWLKWDKNGIVVTPTTRISIVEKDDVKILEIGEVTQEDAGLYRVRLENDFGRIEASARLEVISRHGSLGRTIRTRSASPRTYPYFSRNLLDTTTRTDGRLRLQCGLRGTPSPTPTWYRNGRPLTRSNRIKRHFDGNIAKIEISKVKASDAGEYSCVATNALGSARNTCQVTVLDPNDSSTLDKESPKFLQSLPKESIVMEGNSFELRTRLTGTPPFSIHWLKDKREIPDGDCHHYVLYNDGGIVLRLSDIHPEDAGEYACIVRNEFGEISCSGLLAVQDYKSIRNLAPRFSKTPLTRIVAKGETACFCVRVQCEKPMDFFWTINGKDVRDNARCKVEKDGNVCSLKVHEVCSRDAGEIRCTASVLGNGPSICCTTELQLNRGSCTFENCTISNSKKERTMSHNREKSPSPLSSPSTSFRRTPLSSSCRRSKKERHILSTNASCQQEDNKFQRARSSSLPLRKKEVSSPKELSPLPKKKNVLLPTDRSNLSNKQKNESDAIDLIPSMCTERSLLTSSPDKEYIKDDDESSNQLDKFVPATIVNAPNDVTVFRGNKLVLDITYRGDPEPLVKWFRAGRELKSEEKIKITYGAGVSYLTLNNITADHAGKYEVSVENLLARNRQFFSLAVEGKYLYIVCIHTYRDEKKELLLTIR
ncbi:hypothetical protein M0804_001641 [Polistes exclamans]|nr:hypothetical protein M0804_001641 [Polistes exclamans]